MPLKKQPLEDYLAITKDQQRQAIEQIGCLLKERRALQQSLATLNTTNNSNNEQLFLELLAIFDTLESLIDYFESDRQVTERAIERLPKSLSTIQSKLLSILARRHVKMIEVEGNELKGDFYQVVDTQINPNLTEPAISKVVRQGFTIGDNLLRPVEVTIDSPG